MTAKRVVMYKINFRENELKVLHILFKHYPRALTFAEIKKMSGLSSKLLENILFRLLNLGFVNAICMPNSKIFYKISEKGREVIKE